MRQVTDKLYHIMLYTSTWSRFELLFMRPINWVEQYHVIMVSVLTSSAVDRGFESRSGHYPTNTGFLITEIDLFWSFRKLTFGESAIIHYSAPEETSLCYSLHPTPPLSDSFLKLDPRLCNLLLRHCICIMYSKHFNRLYSVLRESNGQFLSNFVIKWLMKPTSYESVLGTFIKKLKVKGSSFFLQI
jgi:hypothetical protein